MNNLFKYIIYNILVFFLFMLSQPIVQINDDWTVNSHNGPCDCSNDFNNGSFYKFF